jgi:uncharacterized protein (DUF1684 family)
MTPSNAWREELVTERRMKDEFMARHPESPFVAGRVPFHELRYFPPDTKYRVRATLHRIQVPEEAYLRTNRDGQAVMRYLGDLSFSLEGKKLKLAVYHAGEGVGTSVFVPFRDRTSGDDSYGPGRYLTLELNEADEYDIDFNRAFNPYCAYTDEYECGFPPAENDLPVAVRAGEKAWAADRNPRTPSSAVLEQTRAALGRSKPPSPAPRAKAGAAPKKAPVKRRPATGSGTSRGSR